MAPRRAPDERGPFLGTEQIIKRLREVRQPRWHSTFRTSALVGVCASALLVAGVLVVAQANRFRGRPHAAAPADGGRGGAAREDGDGAAAEAGPQVDSRAPTLEASYEGSRGQPADRRRGRAARAQAAVPRAAEADADEGSEQAAAAGDDGLSAWQVDGAAEPAPPSRPAKRLRPAAPARASAARPATADADPTQQGTVRIDILGPPGAIFVDGKRVAVDTQWDVTLAHGDHSVMVRLAGRNMSYRLRLREGGVRLVFDDKNNRIRQEAWTAPTGSP